MGRPILMAVTMRAQGNALPPRIPSAGKVPTRRRGEQGLPGAGKTGRGPGSGADAGKGAAVLLAPTRGRPPASLGAAGSSGRQWPLRAPEPGPPCPPVAGERPPKPAGLGSRRRPEVGARGSVTPGGGAGGRRPPAGVRGAGRQSWRRCGAGARGPGVLRTE